MKQTKRKQAKTILCLLLSVLLLLGVMPSALAAIPEKELTGKCGTYAFYALSLSTGELRIYPGGGAKSAAERIGSPQARRSRSATIARSRNTLSR